MDTNKLEQALVQLIKKERYYAELLMRMKRELTVDEQTLCVIIQPEGLTLRVNPYFIDQVSIEEAAELLKHECEHVLRSHANREKRIEPDLHKDGGKCSSIFDYLGKMDTKQLLNRAEDYEINESLPKLPRKFKIFDKEGNAILDPETGLEAEFAALFVDELQAKFPSYNIKRKQTMEYYYNIIKEIRKDEQEKQQQNPQQGQQQSQLVKNSDGSYTTTVDSHEELEKALEQLDPEIAKEIVKNLANEAYDALPNADRGKVTADTLLLIDKLNRKTVDWRKQLRQFKESCMAVIQEETRKRRNRRYGLLLPGRRMKPQLHIVNAMDTSGSIYSNPEFLNQFHAEINAISKTGVKITVVEIDTVVKRVYEFNPKTKPTVQGGGGTAFAPLFKLIGSKKFTKEWGKVDGLIFFTDGENFDTIEVKKPRYRVLWALLPGHTVSYDWGSKCHIEVDKNGKRAI